MSLYSILRTGVSGLNAQSNKLGTIADNIANTGTTGYKRSSTEFSSLIIALGTNDYTSGVVATDVRHDISRQGALEFTPSPTDLAIQGDGFFVVRDANGNEKLTRAGSFEVDGRNGHLVNAGGFTLMGVRRTEPDPALPTTDVALRAALDEDPGPNVTRTVEAFDDNGDPFDIQFEFAHTSSTPPRVRPDDYPRRRDVAHSDADVRCGHR